MLDICLLGTGGMMPLPNRFLTSLLARYNGNSVLIDCGEGTQVAVKKKGWSVNPIGLICITHFHGDHVAGIPGLLLSIGNSGRTEPITILGPKGIEKVIKSLCIIAQELPFDVNFVEIEGDSGVFEFFGMKIEAFKLKHNVICYGYNIIVDRAGRFLPEKANVGTDFKKAKQLNMKGKPIHLIWLWEEKGRDLRLPTVPIQGLYLLLQKWQLMPIYLYVRACMVIWSLQTRQKKRST